jgi:hypothetical protein
LKPNPNRPPLAMFVILIVSSKLKNVSVQTSISCRRALNSGTAIVLAVLTITFFGIMLSATAVRAELVTISSKAGGNARVDSSVKDSFVAFIEDFEEAGGTILFMGGWRSHGSCSRCLMHPRGLALDICQHARNVVDSRCRFPPNATALADQHGLYHGAQWNNKDTGHFEIKIRDRISLRGSLCQDTGAVRAIRIALCAQHGIPLNFASCKVGSAMPSLSWISIR